MSECIVRMKMPENCFPCSTKINPEERQCNIDGHIFEETLDKLLYGRDINCPIVCSLPEGHGRLVDADELVAEFHRLTLGENSLIEKFFADGVYAVIDNAPTIVPADVERSET